MFQNFEYKVLKTRHAYSLEKDLNDAAKEGWKLHSSSSTKEDMVCIMHRTRPVQAPGDSK